MTLSLNEVEALAKKATRGAGYPWGVAEEAGKGTRWLCSKSVDGCAVLADLLTECDGLEISDRTPLTGKAWTSPVDRLCPLLTGAALADHSHALTSGDLRIEDVSRPILLAPFAGLAARSVEETIVLAWDDVRIATDGATLTIEGDTGAASATVTVTVGDDYEHVAPQPSGSRASPDADTLATLNRFAHRTYAPATEASRLSGAGAGLSDND